jgi:hypothetical protein
MRSAFGYGSGFRRIALTTLNTVVLAPTPRARVRMTMAAKAGSLRSRRAAYRAS